MKFTKPYDEKPINFEKEIAYFYGAENPEPIATCYQKPQELIFDKSALWE